MLEEPHKIGKDRFAGGGGIFTRSSFCSIWKGQRLLGTEMFLLQSPWGISRQEKPQCRQSKPQECLSTAVQACTARKRLLFPILHSSTLLMSEGGCQGLSPWGSGVSWTQGQLHPRTLSHASEKKSFKPVASRKLPKCVRLQRAPGDHETLTASTQVSSCTKNVKRK